MAAEVALPYRTDWREMRSVLDYCKGKGADRGALEARFGAGESLRETLNALEQLELIERGDGGDVRLTQAGEQMAYAPDQARLRARLVEALLRYAPYRFPLERALADELDLLESLWVEHIWQVDMRLGQPRNRVGEARTFFFRLVDEAGLGTYRRGVRGQMTRIELANTFATALRPLLERPGPATAGVARATPSFRQDAAAAISETPGMEETLPGATASSVPPAVDPTVPGDDAASVVTRWAAPAGSGSSAPVAGLAGSVAAPLSVHVDMSGWELEKIEAFLRLIGYLPQA